MTERQKKLLENLPKCNNNLSKAALMSGYSKGYAYSSLHNDLRKPTNRIAMTRDNEDEVKKKYLKKIKKLQKKMLSEKDNTNLMRSVEIEGKVQHLFSDTINNIGNTKEITIVYADKSTQPVDTNKDIAIL